MNSRFGLTPHELRQLSDGVRGAIVSLLASGDRTERAYATGIVLGYLDLIGWPEWLAILEAGS